MREVGERATLRAVPFTAPRSGGVVVVAVSLRSYEAAESYALLLSIASGIVVVALAGVTAGWATRRTLRPVAEMAATASQWSEHDLGRRFDLGPPSSELTALAATLDALLDQVAGAIRAEQRLTAELAHELRTPLTTIRGLTDLTLLRDDLPPEVRARLHQVSAASDAMGASITALLEMARADAPASTTCPLGDVITAAVASARATGRPAQIDLVAQPAEATLLDLTLPLALRTIGPVLDNAVRHAATAVRIAAFAPGDGTVVIAIEDDGPGITTDDDIFDPGVSTTGGGLGLPLARRVARSAGGDVTLTRRGDPTRFEVRLPRA